MLLNMSTPGTLIYECERCGKRIKGSRVEDATYVFNAIVSNDLKYFKKHKMDVVKSSDIHYCDDGHIGIIKLIGCEFIYDYKK